MSWSRKLSRPLHTIDGKAIKTLANARAYAAALPPNYSIRQHWKHAAQLMMAAADGGSIAAASDQIERALGARPDRSVCHS